MNIIANILNLIYLAIFASVSFYDLRERRIPNKIVYPAIVFALVAMFYHPGWRTALLGGLFGAGIMLFARCCLWKERGDG